MKFLFSLSILSILFFSLSCKTSTQDESQVELQEKPQSIVIPVASLGNVSETRKKILQNSLEDELKEHFSIISQERFEEAQEKAFEELDYEECTEDQCIMLIQEMLQIENVFHLEVISEGSYTQLSLSWKSLDEKKKEEQFCENCETGQLRKLIGGLVGDLVGIKKEIIVQRNSDDKEKKIERKIKLIDNPNRGRGFCETICEGLIGYYPFNGNAEDKSGNQYNGELNGVKLTYNHRNIKESAYHFDGESSYIKIPNLNIWESNISVVFTLKIDSYPSEDDEYPTFALFWDMDPGDRWIGIKYTGNKDKKKVEFAWNTSNDTSASYYTKHYDNKYYHLVGIYDHDKQITEIHINGSRKAASRLNKSQKIEFTGVKIGIRDEMDLMRPGAFHGVIDEIRIYDRILKSEEIKFLYQDSGV